MFKKIGILALLMLCFTLNVDAQKNSKDAQRKAKLKEMERQRKAAEQEKKGKKSKDKGTKEVTTDDVKEANEKPEREWLQRIVFGGGLGGGYSNGWNVNVTPWVGYKITEQFWAGLGLDYYYSSYNYQQTDRKDSYSVIGPKAFALYYVTPAINLGAKFSRNTFNVTQTLNNVKYKDSGATNSLLLGGGYTQRVGGRGGIRLELYYDVLYDESNDFNFRRSAFIPRINVVYGF